MATSMFVHEAFTQRQFVRLRTPLLVTIGDKTYRSRDWSVAAVRVDGVDPLPRMKELVELKLKFQFENFALEMEATAEVNRVDPAEKAAVYLFTELSPTNLSLLHYLVGALISGESLTASDVLAIAQRDNFTAPRRSSSPVAEDKGALAKRLGLIAVLWLVGLGLVGFVLISALSRAFVVDSNGVLTSSAPQTVRAPDTGAILAWSAAKGERVQPRQALASMETLEGARLTVASPCDCIVADPKVEPGEVLGRGAPLLTLAPATAPLAGEFVVPLADAKRLRQGDSVHIDFFGQHPPIKGRVKTVNLPTFPDESAYARDRNGAMQLTALVHVELEERVPFTLIGRPAAARINTLRTPF